MSVYKKATPGQQGVRLRDWGPARLNQLKLFLRHLERAVNTSLAAQVSQSSKRKFSNFVPIIPSGDIEVIVEFREIRMTFTPPLGLRGLLFYEYQISETLGFFQFESFTSPESVYVFPDLEDNSSYYVRVRIVTKGGFVGPFSDIFQANTPAAKAQATVTATETTFNVTSTSFTDIATFPYTSFGANVYYAIQYEIIARTVSNDPDFTTYWADLEFQWTVDDMQVGQNFLVTVHSGVEYTGGGSRNGSLTDEGTLHAITGEFNGNMDVTDVNKRLTVPGPYEITRTGSFIQKFAPMAEGNHFIRLRARILPEQVHPTPNDFTVSTAVAIDYTQGATVKLKNFEIFEASVEI